MSRYQCAYLRDHVALNSLTQHGDRFVELENIQWAELVTMAERSWRAGAGKRAPCGLKPWNAEVMVRVLLLKRLDSLSDEQFEYQLRDSLSILCYVLLGLDYAVQDRGAIWLYANQLVKSDVAQSCLLHSTANLPNEVCW